MIARKERKGKKEMTRVNKLCKLDESILKALYEYRALSTKQIEWMFNLSRWYTYEKLQTLRNRRLILSEPISGIKKKGNLGKYHRISETGIACLKKQGVLVERQDKPIRPAHKLKVSKWMLPYLLATNDLVVNLSDYGWKLTDSRETKARFGFNLGDNIQGLLKHRSSQQEYGIYMFFEHTSKKNIQKMIGEITRYKEIHHFIIFVRGKNIYREVINHLQEDEKAVPKSRSLKILPHIFGINYLRYFWNEEQVLAYAERCLGVHVLKRLSPVETRWSALNTIVEHNGEEKYFLNLLDTDLSKIFSASQYRKERYEAEGRKLLVLKLKDKNIEQAKNEEEIEVKKDPFSHIQHVEYIDVTFDQLADYWEAL
ncbi:hypothetical protein SD78_1769 [Bacillus badius]|nr:hypothetical protein SD78_1769 [Bacillus badius]